jgi:hypothetical protein
MPAERRTIARRLLSREVVKAPAAVARRVGTRVARYEHALRNSRPPEEALRRALVGTSGTPSFFFPRGGATDVASYLAEAVPGWRERTLADADRICDHVVRLLGEDGFDLGPGPLPWHDDVLNDYRWDPRTFYKQVPVPVDRADVKVPWELSRFQHLTTVGMAYAASGEERYAAEVTGQIRDWIAANPVGYGINWASTMDVAMRAVGMLWARELIAGSEAATDEFATRLLASLLQHGRHVERNISVYEGGVTTNHTVADYAALVYLGVMLPELRDAAAWRERGVEGLAGCMGRHVSADGVDFENSIAYHRLVLEMYAGALVLAERNGLSFPAPYRESLERMFEFVLHYTGPDGLAPLVGDSDDGRWELLADYSGWEPRDHRYLLALGGALFERDDFEGAARGAPGAVEEVAWLLGPDAVTGAALPPPALGSRAFADGGRYVMRHGRHHALVSTDEVGTGGFGNHKHNDILAFELTVDGEPVAVDCGSYTYLADTRTRAEFRATRTHNTLVVDGAEQNELTDTFRARTDARVEVHEWRSDERLDVLEASHTGYMRRPEPVRHRRTIRFAKAPFAWLVLDVLDGEGRHMVESHLHLAPGGELVVAPATIDPAAVEALGVDALPEPRPSEALLYGGRIAIVPLGWGPPAIEEGWFSPRYGQRTRAPMMRLAGTLEPGIAVGYLLLQA